MPVFFTKERFYCWLVKSIDLFQPQNSEYYVDFDETGEPVFKEPNEIRPPKHLPQHLRNVQDISSETCDRLFHTTIDLVHPDFDEELPKLSQMDFNDSARMLFYIHRANLKFGQKFFYRVWHVACLLWQQRLDYASGGRTCDHMRFCANGNASRVLEHMLQLL
ncbi:MAG: hypothetical protein J6L88_00235 [Clostridia bacterium]|nr:hypothetical protein [Clostridia bacterium]